MCGIAGIYAFTDEGKKHLRNIGSATNILQPRGPDGSGIYQHDRVALGHTRLAVVDLSSEANQPITDTTGRYTIVANGEIYNHNALRKELFKRGKALQTNSDIEVILYLYILDGPECLQKLNGFFSFAIYDSQAATLFIARDRFGIKPLLFFQDRNKLFFSSNMKSMVALGIPKDIDRISLRQYFQFNYIPSPHSIFENVTKLSPGHYLFVKDNQVTVQQYHCIKRQHPTLQGVDYPTAQKKLRALISESVRLRMMSDVPLGAFLSGGVDSSIIVAEASRYKPGLETFSISFKDTPYFDETRYAELVAAKFKTSHHSFNLTNQDLYENLPAFLNEIDEPFADSSALAVYFLSQKVRKHVTVALSGDGADELFGGYNKHRAHFNALNAGMLSSCIKHSLPLWQRLPKSRHTRLTNLCRQLERYGKGLKLSAKERYWIWASVFSEDQVKTLITASGSSQYFQDRKDAILKNIFPSESLSDILYTDMQTVLVSDMLYKIDSMSMANSLEVRTPFLDHNLVDFAFALDDTFKITRKMGKRVLQDAYRNVLPPALYGRAKKGFEVPLLQWFRTELREEIESTYLNQDFIEEQQIFNPERVRQLKECLFSSDPGDVHAPIWALIVFQQWWKQYMG
jgi:asparagine synthase (glutamine-hydrolysing)